MRMLYATSIDLPSTRANRFQVVSMAKAFSEIIPSDFLLGISYKEESFKLNLPYVQMGRKRSFLLAYQYLRLAKERGISLIYCREEKMLFTMIVLNNILRLPLQFVFEIHHLSYINKWWFTRLLQKVKKIVSITKAMKDELIRSSIREDKIIVAPDAVDFNYFQVELSQAEIKEKLKLPKDKKIIMYTGSIDELWKGVEVLYEAANYFPSDFLLAIVGGKPHYVEDFLRRCGVKSNAILVGHKSHDEIPMYLKAADVLVLPNSAKAEISRVSTSPMKLFEYMASGVPIVASDLVSIREILNENNAVLVEPDDPKALANGIINVIQSEKLRARIVSNSSKAVRESSWTNRARKIIEQII